MMLLMLIVIVVGLGLPVQAGINAQLARHLPHPFHAGWISFLGGLVVMSIGCVLAGQTLFPVKKLLDTPWYLWTGGVFGAVLVFTAIICAPRLGATVLVACLITGQLISSVILDHYGWAGFSVHPVSAMRMLGVAFLVVGLFLVRFF